MPILSGSNLTNVVFAPFRVRHSLGPYVLSSGMLAAIALAGASCTTGGPGGGGPFDASTTASDAGSDDAGVDIFDKKDAKFTLGVVIDTSGVTILSVDPYDPTNPGLPSVPSDTKDSLKWVIEDDSGKEVAHGYVPDPRIVIAEGGSEGATMYREDSAMFRLDVPTDQGTLQLYENNPTF